MSEIEKIANDFGRSLASDDVCSEKAGVNAEKCAEIAVKNTGFRELVVDWLPLLLKVPKYIPLLPSNN